MSSRPATPVTTSNVIPATKPMPETSRPAPTVPFTIQVVPSAAHVPSTALTAFDTFCEVYRGIRFQKKERSQALRSSATETAVYPAVWVQNYYWMLPRPLDLDKLALMQYAASWPTEFQ